MSQIAGEELIIELPHREPSFNRASLVARTLFDHSSGGQLIGRFDAAGPGQGVRQAPRWRVHRVGFFCPGESGASYVIRWVNSARLAVGRYDATIRR